jgi:hypothetical protein
LNPPDTNGSNHCERRFQFSSPHAAGVYFRYGDGHVEFVRDTIDRLALKGLTTVAGTESTVAN